MTTLIIHPKTEVQQKKALELVERILEIHDDYLDMAEINHPDLHIIDGTQVSSIGIEDIKILLHSLQYQPYQAKKQVGVILFSDALTIEAQNSLLKTLEEPGPQTEFILTVSHEKNILPTILSRTNIIHVDSILNEKNEADDFNLNDFTNLNVLDKFKIIEDLIDREKENNQTIKAFLTQLTHHYREKLIYAIRIKKGISRASKDLKEISKAVHYISKNVNKRLALENLILQLEHRTP